MLRLTWTDDEQLCTANHNKELQKMKITLALPDELHKQPCTYLTLNQKPKLLYWRYKS